ncbi:MAG: fluoride efflux transporter CrcB [Muribaculaceae bacterium]|nr:fluoride efflux transporter CrcB [Muribaculaceae bacterium]
MNTLSNIFIVGAGSCLGGVVRYLLSRVVQSGLHTAFPWGTLVVNLLGCFVIGLVYGLIDRGFQLSDSMRLFITVGFCGGFTTFSTFMHENYLLFTAPNHLLVALYLLASVTAGFIMVYAAYSIARMF